MILLDPEARPVIGHRGASGEFPENTMLAFEQAMAQGADGLEFDVRLSADGVPVVIHDGTLERTTSGSGPVAALSSEELRRLDAGKGEHVPSVRDVLARFGGTPLIIEIKEPAAARPVSQLLELFGMGRRVLAGAFEHEILVPLRQRGVVTSASRRETARWWLWTRLALAPWASAYQAFTVPERQGRLRVVDRRFMRAARRRGLPVHVWTVNDVEDARRLRDLGVNGLITNFPGRMLEAGTGNVKRER